MNEVKVAIPRWRVCYFCVLCGHAGPVCAADCWDLA